MKMKAWEWAVWIALCIAPLAAAAAALGSLPDTIALHAGVHGVIDRYGSKYETLHIAAILGLPNLALMLVSWKALHSSPREPSTASTALAAHASSSW